MIEHNYGFHIFDALLVYDEPNEMIHNLFPNSIFPLILIKNVPLVIHHLNYLENNGIFKCVITCKQNVLNILKEYLENYYHGKVNYIFFSMNEKNDKMCIELSQCFNNNIIILQGNFLFTLKLFELMDMHLNTPSILSVVIQPTQANTSKKNVENKLSDYNIYGLSYDEHYLSDFFKRAVLVMKESPYDITDTIGMSNEDSRSAYISKGILTKFPKIIINKNIKECGIYLCTKGLLELMGDLGYPLNSLFDEFLHILITRQIEETFQNKINPKLNKTNLNLDERDKYQDKVNRLISISTTRNKLLCVCAFELKDSSIIISKAINEIKEYKDINFENYESTNLIFEHKSFYFEKDKNIIKTQISSTAVISNSSKITSSIIGKNVIIEDGCEIIRSIIFDNVIIKKNSNLRNCIVLKGVTLKEGSKIADIIEQENISNEKPQKN